LAAFLVVLERLEWNRDSCVFEEKGYNLEE
jgi:hypothetical protein